MELIYTDEKRFPLGQLESFDIDFDATGDKNFELTIDEYILKKGYWIFIPGTEIGGIIDSITVNTESHTVKYIGRNFRGVLNDKVIPVPRGWSYVSAQGDLTEEINELLSNAGLSGSFNCLPCNVEEDVSTDVGYSFTPFCTLYEGIMGMAASINCKLIFAYNVASNKVEITPMLKENFTDFLTYTQDSSVNLELEDNSMAINHFQLVGYNDNKRYQISLFVNPNSQIMPYSSVWKPIKDSQYILDNRNQKFFGTDEKVRVDITDSISPIENYEYTRTKPTDWWKNYANYYYQKKEITDDKVVQISYEPFETKTGYQLLSSQPSDWSSNYGAYFTYSGGNYSNVQAESTTTTTHKVVSSKPSDWSENYGNYYYYETDGVTWYYTSVPGVSKDSYSLQIYQPTDWDSNWGSYYQVLKNPNNGKTNYESADTYWKKGKKQNGKRKYTKETYKKVKKWKKNKYYTKFTNTNAPKFSKKTVYAEVSTTTENAPTFASNTYYKQYSSAPNFNGCYRKVLDHYGGMIQKCIESLDLKPVNKQTVKLVDFEADIGDVVGGYDEKTKIELSAPITNIIYRIERGIQRSIEYEIGG